jgi:hypothetical protein
MSDDAAADRFGAGPPGETSWARLARFRELRTWLDEEITAKTPAAIAESRAAGVSAAQLAELWKVTQAWIYTLVPARPKKSGGKTQQ